MFQKILEISSSRLLKKRLAIKDYKRFNLFMKKPSKYHRITSKIGMKTINKQVILTKNALNSSKNRLRCWQKRLSAAWMS